jgi:hypothetical protein
MLPRDLKASRKEFVIELHPAGVGCVAYPVGVRGEEHHPLSMQAAYGPSIDTMIVCMDI